MYYGLREHVRDNGGVTGEASTTEREFVFSINQYETRPLDLCQASRLGAYAMLQCVSNVLGSAISKEPSLGSVCNIVSSTSSVQHRQFLLPGFPSPSPGCFVRASCKRLMGVSLIPSLLDLVLERVPRTPIIRLSTGRRCLGTLMSLSSSKYEP